MPDTAGQSNCDCRRDVGGGGRGGGADNARLLDRILPTAIHTYQVCMQFRLTNYNFLKFQVRRYFKTTKSSKDYSVDNVQ